LKAISDDDTYAKHNIPLVIAAMVYAESILGVEVDWSSLPTGLRAGYQVRRPVQIPMKQVPRWFLDNPTLLREPENYHGQEK